MSIEKLNNAFGSFVEQPSEANAEALLKEISDYPVNWGLGMAEGHNIGKSLAKKVKGGVGYEPERLSNHVTSDADGNRLSLLLQRRVEDGIPWHVLSWRSVYPGTNSNRRFYMSADGEPWSTPVESALSALQYAESEGWLVDENLDLRRRPECQVEVSTEMDEAERRAYLNSFIVPGESFENPDFFVVCEDPNQDWRKIMLINDGRATFRSATTDPEYGMLKHLHNGVMWNLDNSMQDCNVQQGRAFLEQLTAYME